MRLLHEHERPSDVRKRIIYFKYVKWTLFLSPYKKYGGRNVSLNLNSFSNSDCGLALSQIEKLIYFADCKCVILQNFCL